MINIKRFNGEEELNILLKQFVSIPTNVEIIERTGFSAGLVSGIMNGKVKPSKSFIDKFKKGFKMEEIKKENPSLGDEGLNFKEDNLRLISENQFLKETIKDLIKILASK